MSFILRDVAAFFVSRRERSPRKLRVQRALLAGNHDLPQRTQLRNHSSRSRRGRHCFIDSEIALLSAADAGDERNESGRAVAGRFSGEDAGGDDSDVGTAADDSAAE